MNKVLNMTYASSLTNLCEVNSSFDTGILRICYTGKNRNGSFISKEAIKKSLKTIYNCPIVCNYDRETNTLGGHDMELVRDENGELYIANITQPVGVIPESSNVWFEDYVEEDGTVHEYLYAEALLWKRQEAYRKIKEDGITAHSMEITVKDGNMTDGIYHINDFEFTAFALIGVEPCYEGSALEMFSKQDFKQQLSEMMHDLKESFKQVITSHEVDNIHSHDYSTEGGKMILEDKKKLIAKYGIDINSLDFSIEDFTLEELTEKFEAIKAASGEGAPMPEVTAASTDDKFALTSNITEELYRVLGEEKTMCEWGECPRYIYVDSDFDLKEVYCWDSNDWLLYGFPYAIDGDSITIDFKCKKRKKYVIADFDEGEQASPFSNVFSQMEQKIHDNTEWEAKYQNASVTIKSLESELDELRQFKANTETAIEKGKRDEVFARFEELVGIEAFESLREDCMKYDINTLEEKCYAIRGRNSGTAKFSLEGKSPKLKIEKTDVSNEPYGALFIKYGINTDN